MYLINREQKPLLFSLSSDITLILIGDLKVIIQQPGQEKTCCTMSFSICADGSKLKPMITFNEKIAKSKLPRSDYCDLIVFSIQPNDWQNQENMNDWIDHFLVPHIQQMAGGMPVILLLYKFSAHWFASLMARMQTLGVQLLEIPAGCTWL